MGPDQTDINLKADNGRVVCSEVSIIGSDKLRCVTTAGIVLPEYTELETLIGTGTTYGCVNDNVLKCVYDQISGAAFPAVTTITKTSSSVVTVVGTDFNFDDTSEFSPMVTIEGVNASSVVLDSAT
mmetsp:Transcript_20884/g.32254  ORF Transcript_20884/g.32254 Transcript_20884/m.32254 type:complete len:126 (+) Transcript_20884:4036-4413(+)